MATKAPKKKRKHKKTHKRHGWNRFVERKSSLRGAETTRGGDDAFTHQAAGSLGHNANKPLFKSKITKDKYPQWGAGKKGKPGGGKV